MCPQVDTADSQVVATANETGLQLQSSPVGGHGLLWPASVGERGPQLIPQQVVLMETEEEGKKFKKERTETNAVWRRTVAPPRRLPHSTLTCGVTDRAALKQSTALSYSPLRLKRTPRPHCSWGSTWAGSELAACRNSDWTSVNKDLGRKTKRQSVKRDYNVWKTPLEILDLNV